jgi:hypothetical protein
MVNFISLPIQIPQVAVASIRPNSGQVPMGRQKWRFSPGPRHTLKDGNENMPPRDEVAWRRN